MAHLFAQAARAAVFATLMPVAGAMSATPVYALCLEPAGDLTGDGLSNVTDAQCGLLAVLSELDGSSDPACLNGDPSRADLDCNGSATVVDVQIAISLALGLDLPATIDADATKCADTCEASSATGCLADPTGCDDANPCTVDTCLPDGLCAHAERGLMPCSTPPCAVNDGCLYTIHRGDLSDAEVMLFATLQGVLAQTRPALWFEGQGQSAAWRNRLESHHGVAFHPIADPWELFDRFGSALSGFIRYELFQDSQNVATSLAGHLGAVAADESVSAALVAKGLTEVMNVIGKDEAWAWTNYAGVFTPGVAVEQLESAPFHSFLHDFAAAERAFTFHAGNGPLRTTVTAGLGPSTLVFGWGGDSYEFEFVEGTSLGGGGVVPANFSANLSVLSRTDEPPLVQSAAAASDAPLDPGAHYVAFLVSDGDNIQWLQTQFGTNKWWGSPRRGDFPLSWEFAPSLAEVAPPVMAHYYAEASPLDRFVAGPSGAGYSYPALLPNPAAFAERTNALLAASDLEVVTILDSEAQIEESDPWLEQPEVTGVVFKTFYDYNAASGGLHWHNGKPAIGVTHLLWNNGTVEDSPTGVAATVNAAPHAPATNLGSFSVVNVHAWSTWPTSPLGPYSLDAVAWTLELFAPHVKVVTVDELVQRLVQAKEAGAGGGGPWTFEAEADLQHQQGLLEFAGWGCQTATHGPNHMCYGPYTSAVPAGPHSAQFWIMVDNTTATNDKVATIDVYDSASGSLLALQDLYRHDFAAPLTYQAFPLSFSVPNGAVLEFRTYWHDTSYVNVDKVVVD